jgi:hypothetical protein
MRNDEAIPIYRLRALQSRKWRRRLHRRKIVAGFGLTRHSHRYNAYGLSTIGRSDWGDLYRFCARWARIIETDEPRLVY